MLPVIPIAISPAIAGDIAAAHISDEDFEKPLGLPTIYRLKDDSASMQNLEPMVRQIVDQIGTEVKNLSGRDPGEPVVRIFDFVKGALVSNSPTFILPLPRRKDPDLAPKLPKVKFEESGKLVRVRFRAFSKAGCEGYLLGKDVTMSLKDDEEVSIMMVRFPPE